MSKKPVLMPKAERREAALQVALKLAKKVGAKRVSIAMVAAAQNVTAPLLFHIFESRDGLTKAINKAAKAQGIVLPEAAPTVREQRAATRKAQPKKLKALPKLKKPAPVKVKKLAPPKPLPKVKLPINVVKAIKNKEAAKVPTPAKGMTVKAKKGEDLRNVSAADLIARARKPLTPAQREAKQQRDRARRAAAVPSTPASNFAALPKPFEAAIQQVAS